MLYVSVIERQETAYEDNPIGMIARMQQHLNADDPYPLSPDNDFEASILKRCDKDETLPYAHMLVVIIWLSRMLMEVIDSLQYAQIVWTLSVGTEIMEVS